MRACVNKCAISNEHFLVGILVPHASVSAKSKGEKGEREQNHALRSNTNYPQPKQNTLSLSCWLLVRQCVRCAPLYSMSIYLVTHATLRHTITIIKQCRY